MELTVRVMMAGREIDRITRQHKVIDGNPFVVYRRREWLVEDGRIHVDTLPSIPMRVEDSAFLGKLGPLLDLIEKPHAERLSDCALVLRSSFPNVPDAFVASISTLVQLGLPLIAKEVLMDFLELTENRQLSVSSDPSISELGHGHGHGHNAEEAFSHQDSKGHGTINQPTADDCEDYWLLALQPEQGWSVADTDDSELRDLAGRTQALIGSHVAMESGLHIADLSEPAVSEDCQVVLPSKVKAIATEVSEPKLMLPSVQAPPPPRLAPTEVRSSTLPEQQLAFIVEKTASLGETALEVLRYFADNPDDKSSHAEQFTGIPRGMINALLTGTLGRYVKRTDTGGWACHSWVSDVMGVMDGSLK
ncbi:hypothetical protein OC926_18780 [Pseudomonas peradeniyensis]|uniref:hypothetical protein n=1 Tax=Pseudomonas peradeniyensis TaxID=2745488 RepID=UPI0021D50210|nr:hypothetical protein [Pseudomonas peradeniyensis]MCU7281896.1 hypothetical protein [Pseudomonas peradeniyensis]